MLRFPKAIFNVLRTTIRHILGSLLNLALIVAFVLVAVVLWGNDPLVNYGVLLLFYAVVVFVMWQFRYFAKRDPARLHSEKHLSEMAAMALGSTQLPLGETKNLDIAEIAKNPNLLEAGSMTVGTTPSPTSDSDSNRS